MKIVLKVIQILLKAKLLTANSDDVSELTPQSIIELFTGYKKYFSYTYIEYL
jgi:hypothetical protein